MNIATVMEHDLSGALRKLAVTIMPSTPTKSTRASKGRGKARESMLVEEHGTMVLGGGETRPFLLADHMPRAVEVRSQLTRIRTSCRSRIPREDLVSRLLR